MYFPPSTAIVILLLVALLLRRLGLLERLAQATVVTCVLFFALVLFTPLAVFVARPLELRFYDERTIAADKPPVCLIQLAGAERRGQSSVGPWQTLNDQAMRYITLARYAKAYPTADVIFTGGHVREDLSEKDVAADMHSILMPGRAVTYLQEARSTYGNALEVRDWLLENNRGTDVCLLITSAMHMPRAFLSFQARAINVQPAPSPARVAHRSFWQSWRHHKIAFTHFRTLDLALHEWLGLLTYRLTGKTDRVWP